MIPIGYVLPPKVYRISMLNKGINILKKKFYSGLAMPILRNLRTAGSPLPVFTNWVLLFLKLKLRINNFLLDFFF
jgi:hypothetical protein